MSRRQAVRVGYVEFHNQVTSMGEVEVGYPRVVVRPVSSPADQVKEWVAVAMIDFAVEDSLDFIFNVIFDFNWGEVVGPDLEWCWRHRVPIGRCGTCYGSSWKKAAVGGRRGG